MSRSSFKALAQSLAKDIVQQQRPLLAISGAQGSGKSTLAAMVAAELQGLGYFAAVVSLDDFYLSKQARIELAQHVDSKLRQRGVPGTHDISLAMALTKAHVQGRAVALPRFDKALDNPAAAEPLQRYRCLIVEGWCLGVKPLVLCASQGRYQRFVEASLAAYQPWFQMLTPLVYLQAPDWRTVCQWRLQQEQALQAKRGFGMSEADLARFMQAFQPLTERGWHQLPSVATWCVTLDAQHGVTQVEGK